MIPEVYIIIKIAFALVLLLAVIVWLAVVFQSVLFQRYRLNKNEQVHRAYRIHDEQDKERLYRDELLGNVKENAEEE